MKTTNIFKIKTITSNQPFIKMNGSYMSFEFWGIGLSKNILYFDSDFFHLKEYNKIKNIFDEIKNEII